MMLIELTFKETKFISKNIIVYDRLLMKLPELNEFLKYLQKKCTTAA